MARKTEVRVKRTDRFYLTNLANNLNAHKASLHTLRQKNRALEARLKAAEEALQQWEMFSKKWHKNHPRPAAG